MDQALELGINFFDTANVYGGKAGKGTTESILGRWLAQGGRRERVFLASKVYGPIGEGVNERGLSAYHIKTACEASLRRLQTDHIDLYQMHHIDRKTPWQEVWQAMEQLIHEGKIVYVGSSNFAAWHIVQANAAAEKQGLLGLVSEQSKYNLTCREVELEVLPACEDMGIGVIPYSPLASGLLAGVLEKESDQARRSSEKFKKQSEQRRRQVEAYEDLCKQIGQSPADVALAWLLQNPAVTAPITGPRTMEQLTDSVRALELELDSATNERLDEIWPGPGGSAPEAYAW
jgi:aryl-alcohol dehydrogenase-like predicted oxidoreductase